VAASSIGSREGPEAARTCRYPGGDLTGSSPFQFELMPKRLELLTELVPQARVIALLVNPDDPRAERIIGDVQEAARTK
jgi:ABC-type uncharacterized transport system substrate-binding protein